MRAAVSFLLLLVASGSVQATPAANCAANGPDAQNPCCNMPMTLWNLGAIDCDPKNGNANQQLINQLIAYYNQNNCWNGKVDVSGDPDPKDNARTANVFDFVGYRCKGQCVLNGIECTNSISCDDYQDVTQNPLAPYVAGFWTALVILLLLALSNVCYCFCNWRHKRKMAAQQDYALLNGQVKV
jgi:hypothetical protein